MDLSKLFLACQYFLLVFVGVLSSSQGHHEFHRIHIPTKVKTIYKTKVIKVPEHHHYYHHKEKIIQVPQHEHHIAKFEPEPIHFNEPLKETILHDEFEPNKSFLEHTLDETYAASEKRNVYKRPRRTKRLRKVY